MHYMKNLWQDFRYRARLLLKHPGFSLTAIAVLALGIGVNAAIFGLINGVVIRPLVGADAPGELVGVYSKSRAIGEGYHAFSYPGFVDLRDAVLSGRAFGHLAAHEIVTGGVTENNMTRQTMIDIVTSDYFETHGLRPVHGRDFILEEERPGTSSRSVIIIVATWASQMVVTPMANVVQPMTARVTGLRIAA